MKKYLLILSLLFVSISFSQTKKIYSDTVWVRFFEDSVKVYPNLSINPEKYMFTMETVLSNIERQGQGYLDLLGKDKVWFVPKSLSEQIEVILKKHNLVIKWKREGY